MFFKKCFNSLFFGLILVFSWHKINFCEQKFNYKVLLLGRRYFTYHDFTCGCYHGLISQKTKGTIGFLLDEYSVLSKSMFQQQVYVPRVDHFPIYPIHYICPIERRIIRKEPETSERRFFQFPIESHSKHSSMSTKDNLSLNINEIPHFQISRIEYQLIYPLLHQLKYFIYRLWSAD